MKRASVGDARLANQVNLINGNACFIHRSTLRNWRTGSAQKVNNWRQLVTVAIALGLDETEANALLKSGGCPTTRSLTATAKEADKALLAHWQNMPAQPGELTASNGNIEGNILQLSEADEKKIRPKSFVLSDMNVWNFTGVKRNVVACVVVAFGFLSLGYYQYQSGDENRLVNSQFEDGTLGWITYVNDAAEAGFKVENGALQIQIDQPAEKSWHIGLNQKNLTVTAGKIYTARFRVRGDGVASMHVDITRVADPKTSLSFDNSVRQKVTTTKNWTTKSIEFEAIETITAKDGGARLFFRFGKSEKGKIELDDIEFFEGKLEGDSIDSLSMKN